MLLRPFLAATIAAATCAAVMPQPASAEPPRDRYIVVLHDGEADPADVAHEHARRHGTDTGHIYRHALRGYAAAMSREAAERVASDSRVRRVVPDQQVSKTWQDMPKNIDRVYAPATSERYSGIASLTINRDDDVRVDADIAIIDSGVDSTHPDLNVSGGVDCVDYTPCAAVVPTDPDGHGTHVAGTAAAIDNDDFVVGVAPGARIWSVRVLHATGSGTDSTVLAGIDWVTAHAGVIDVANMSLGRRASLLSDEDEALNTALRSSVNAGVTYSVAAGNEKRDALFYVPANHPDVLTVSAISDCDGLDGARSTYCVEGESDDARASFSNYGLVVDLAAPGVLIHSTFPMNHPDYPGGEVWGSGTSMAAPHVAGAAALLTSKPQFRGKPADVRSTLLSNGNLGWLDTSLDGVREPLVEVTAAVFAPATVAGSLAANVLPTASFTYRCRDNTCSFDASGSTDSDGTVERFVWTFGDGTGADIYVPQTYHEYAVTSKSQSFPVTLQVVDDRGGSSATVSKTIVCSRRTNGTSRCS